MVNSLDKKTKRKIRIKKLFVAFLFIVLIYSLGAGYIHSHEFIHRQIFSRYEITSTTYIDSWALSGITIPLGDYRKCDSSCKMQHTLNDIIGYYVVVLVFSLWSIFITYILYKKLLEKKNETTI